VTKPWQSHDKIAKVRVFGAFWGRGGRQGNIFEKLMIDKRTGCAIVDSQTGKFPVFSAKSKRKDGPRGRGVKDDRNSGSSARTAA
jgi:hypothetical protein